jgi:hypothetical protein
MLGLDMSLAEIKTAIEQLSFEERAQLVAWLHGWKDNEWDEEMKRDIAEGRLDNVLREVEDDIAAGRSATCDLLALSGEPNDIRESRISS